MANQPEQNEPNNSRRLKILWITPEVFVDWFKNKEPQTLAFSGIPEDAEIASVGTGNGTYYELNTNLIGIMLRSKEFEEVPLGHTIPHVSVLIRKFNPQESSFATQ
jgi:hypothetical protein